MSFPSKSCLTVRLEFPKHSSLPASMKEQPLFTHTLLYILQSHIFRLLDLGVSYHTMIIHVIKMKH